ncbi:MAG: CehA/McbA family metallohydrolase [Deltaproteobacteria bacterium]|nr:CehA/McbA family metallohydrolase [Deltaproteobacteria bacterium]
MSRSIFLLALLALVGCGDDSSPTDAGVDGATDGAMGDDAGDAGAACVFSVATLAAGGEAAPGPDGIGGEGDLEIRSDSLVAVFAALDRPSGVAKTGGTLIDLHRPGRSDHMNELSQLAGPDQSMQVAYTSLEVSEQTADSLTVQASGFVSPQPTEVGADPIITPDPGENLSFVTTYTFRCASSEVELRSTLTNVGSESYTTSTAAFGILDTMFWGSRSLVPFCPAVGQGDQCAAFDIMNPIAGLVGSAYVGSTGSLVGDPGTFAFYVNEPELGTFVGVHASQVSAFGDFRLGDSTLPAGGMRTLGRVIVLGDDADAASATDGALEGLERQGLVQLGSVIGSVTMPAGESLSSDVYQRPMVVLATPDSGEPTNPARWTPITMARVQADGSFSARVPVGDVSWELRMRGRAPVRGVGGSVAVGETLELGALALPEAPLTLIHVRDDTGAGLPARVVFHGTGTTPDPDLGPAAGGTPAGTVALTDGDGELELRLPVGDYDVYAAHGIRYSLAKASLTVDASGAEVTLSVAPVDLLPAGFVTGDFHVHSAPSFDSSLPVEDRLMAYLAEGVDVIVSTEHDVVFDYAPALATLEAGLPPAWRGRLHTFVGIEATTTVPQPEFIHTIGHHNAYPLSVVPGAHGGGAPLDENVDLGTLYERLRAMPSPVASPVVQLNHARSSRAGSVWLGYFDACGFDPAVAIDESGACFGGTGPMGTRPWDFDAMELINSKGAAHFVDHLRDWYALLLQSPGGRLPVGMANSDSHELILDQAGYPMTFLQTGGAAADLTNDGLVEAVESGSVAGGLGVFVWIRVCKSDGSGCVEPGRAPFDASAGVRVRVTVAAPPWIDVAELRLRVNGQVVERRTAAAGELSTPADPFGVDGVVRFDADIDLTTPTADAFVTAEAGFALARVGDLDGDGLVDATDNNADGVVDAADEAGGVDLGAPPPLLDAVVGGARAMGFVNPVYLDVDGDGMYTPPGVPLVD